MTLFKHTLLALLFGCILLIIYLFVHGWVIGKPDIGGNTSLGEQGDFIGGHLSTSISCLTLIVVLYFGWSQRKDDRAASERASFLEGLNLIAQYELKEPGCTQALRILDYYSKLALEARNDDYLWMLNTVITDEIRKKIEATIENKQKIYIHAQEAKAKINSLMETYHKKKKGLIP